MKCFSACGLILLVVLSACERGVKPSGAGAPKPTTAAAKRESIDQTPELETHPRALAISPPSFETRNIGVPGNTLDLLTREELSKREPTLPPVPKPPDGFLATANHWCPVMQKMKLNASTAVEQTVEFDGQVVGFCCDDCVEAWKVMDDVERRQRLKTVMEKK